MSRLALTNPAIPDATSALHAVNKQVMDAAILAAQHSCNMGKIFDFAGPASTIPAYHVACYGQSLSRTTYASLFAALCPIVPGGSAATCTASNDRITATAHGLVVGDAIFIDSLTGGTGLSADTMYYVLSVVDANNFTVTASRTVTPATGALVLGAVVNITADGTALVVRQAPWGVPSSTNFNVPDLREMQTTGLPTMGGSERTTFSHPWVNVLGLQAGEASHTLTGAESGTSVHTHGDTIAYGNPTFSLTAGAQSYTKTDTTNVSNTTVGGAGVRLNLATQSTQSTGTSAVTGSITQGSKTGSVSNSSAANASSAHNVLNPSTFVNKIIYAGV